MSSLRFTRLGLAALVVCMGLSSQASAQVRVFAFAPGFSYPYSGWGWGGMGAWGGAWRGYGGPYGYGMIGYGGGFVRGYVSYPSYSIFTVPGWLSTGTGIGSTGARASISPAVGVAADSPLLLVGPSGSRARAQLVISVPDCAKVWVEGACTNQSGCRRMFFTPVLPAGCEYSYNVRAQWTDSQGQVRTATRTVSFRCGDVVPVSFTE